MKFGIEILKNIKEAKESDIRNGIDHWVKTIDKEFKIFERLLEYLMKILKYLSTLLRLHMVLYSMSNSI